MTKDEISKLYWEIIFLKTIQIESPSVWPSNLANLKPLLISHNITELSHEPDDNK